MIIRISDLSPAGLDVKETISLEALNERLNEGQESDIIFTSAPLVDVQVSRTADGAQVLGTVTAKYRQSCGRCLEAVEQDLKIPASYILKPRTGNVDEDVDDVGLIYFDGEHIELEPIVQESIILSLSVYWSAPADKDGKCLVCKKNTDAEKNEKSQNRSGVVQLGDLLKKAGLN